MTRTIAEVVRDRVTRGLVGRRRELTALTELIHGDSAFVAYVHGVAGIGKSTLLAAFASRARESGAQVVTLDGRTVEPTDRGFLNGLARALGARADDLDTTLRRLAKPGPLTVILVDHYEVLRLIDTWLRQEFVPRLPDTVRVVIGSREAPVASWMTATDLSDTVIVMALGPLAHDESVELLRQHGVPEASVDDLERIAHGHPLALKLAAAAVAERPELAPRDVAGPRVLEELTRLYLSDVQDPLTRVALEAAAIVRRTTMSLLTTLLPDVVAQDAFDRLRSLPFVEIRSDGLVIHEAVQAQVAGFLRASDPVRHRQLRRTAWHALREEVRSAGPEQLWRYTADMLYLIENPVVREAFFPSSAQPLAIEPARVADLSAIEMISRRHDGAEGWALMRAWWEKQPTSFSVVRDRDGTVRGFHCLLNQTMLMPPRVDDPVVAGWWQHLQGQPPPPGQMVLGYRRWLDIEHGEAPCAAQAASWLDVKRTYMLLRPKLRRMFTVVEDAAPYLQVVLKLGFRPLGEDGSARIGDRQYTSVGLDFGPDSVDGWLAGLVADELGLGPALEIDDAAREVRLDGRIVHLTELELGVLKCLQQRADRAVTRATILEEVWGYRADVGSNVVDAVVRRLREKLGTGSAALETVRGSGYRLSVH